jgi:hypothetical protein
LRLEERLCSCAKEKNKDEESKVRRSTVKGFIILSKEPGHAGNGWEVKSDVEQGVVAAQRAFVLFSPSSAVMAVHSPTLEGESGRPVGYGDVDATMESHGVWELDLDRRFFFVDGRCWTRLTRRLHGFLVRAASRCIVKISFVDLN